MGQLSIQLSCYTSQFIPVILVKLKVVGDKLPRVHIFVPLFLLFSVKLLPWALF